MYGRCAARGSIWTMKASPVAPLALSRSYAASPMWRTTSMAPAAASARRSGIVDLAFEEMPWGGVKESREVPLGC